MGMFEVKVKLTNLAAPGRAEEAWLLVDTRATLSRIPRATLERLGVQPLSRLLFLRTDGSSIEREVAGIILAMGGRSAGLTVAVGEDGESAVLGLTALEALGFDVDPVAKKLVSRNLRAFSATGTNEPPAAYSLEGRLSVLALSRIRAEGVGK
jgi:predicted aspartyl protease